MSIFNSCNLAGTVSGGESPIQATQPWFGILPNLKMRFRHVWRAALPVALGLALMPAASAKESFAKGQFHGVSGKQVTGNIVIAKQSERFVVQLSQFSSNEGPDLKVVLIPVPDFKGKKLGKAERLVVGALRSFRGDQSYELPAGTDLTKYKTALIWCQQYDITFGAALLSNPMITQATTMPKVEAMSAVATTGKSVEVHYRTVQVDGLNIFYREAGPKAAPVVLLLHGYPSSSQIGRAHV